MSNIYRYAKPAIMHFQIPQAIIPKLVYMKLDELRLLMFMHSEFQRTSKSEVSLLAEPISEQTGIHPTNLKAARESLVARGLLLVRKVGKVITYVLCDPADKTPVPDRLTNDLQINFDDATADILRAYFEPHLKLCKTTDNGLSGCCPFPTHTDNRPSFSVELKTGSGGRWNCFGCGKSGKLIDFEVCLSEHSLGVTVDRTEARRRVVDRLRALGVKHSTTGTGEDIVYSYTDEESEIITETVRPRAKKEGMYRRRPHPDVPGRYISNTKGCRNVLYRLPEVIEAYTVLIVEGEPDVETLRKLNLHDSTAYPVAVTTNAYGAGNWLPEHSTCLKGKWVILVGDNDPDGKGLRHMQEVKTSLEGKAKEIRHVVLPDQYRDVSHYLESHSAQELVGLVGEEWLNPVTEI